MITVTESKAIRTTNESILDGRIIRVHAAGAGQGARIELDPLLGECTRRFKGFRSKEVEISQALFQQQIRAADSTSGQLDGERPAVFELTGGICGGVQRLGAVRSAQLPETVGLLSFSQAVRYAELCDYLARNQQELAPAHVLLSTLLTHAKTSCYTERALDGSKVKVETHYLDISGLSDPNTDLGKDTANYCVLAAGGYIKERNSKFRDALFGARTTSKGFEFILPYTTNAESGGWLPGTLFLVQCKRGSNST
jgi:hypothetical protein